MSQVGPFGWESPPFGATDFLSIAFAGKPEENLEIRVTINIWTNCEKNALSEIVLYFFYYETL